jgi:hypothetical protein
MKPTNDDLARLIPDARTEAMTSASSQVVDGTPYDLAEDARHVLAAIIRLLAATTVDWNRVRREALRAMYLCALIVWEAGRRMAPVMQVNDGKGGLRPLEGPTAAETPAAKHDVDALLAWADRAPVLSWGNSSICANVVAMAAGLRAERERADAHRDGALATGHLLGEAHGHLRAVLDFMWPVGGRMTSPTVVQKARAFLAGEAQATVPTCNFCNGALENQSFQGLADRVDEVQRLRKDLAEAKERADQARREVLTEDEAHAATRARRAEVERDLAATKERLADAQHSFKRRADELDYLRAENRKALAAQNLAESEAAGLRAQLVDLETAIRGLVDRVEKGRA